jgi:hemoglobin/transferrin/lactoferrin receptor protein
MRYRYSAAAVSAVPRHYAGTIATKAISPLSQQTYDERALATRPVAIDRYFSFEQEATGLEANLQKSILAGSATHRISYGLEVKRRETEEYRDGIETGLVDGQQTNVLLGETFPLRDFPISRTTEWGAL